MKRYPKYKESGMAWIGEIPKHWKVKRAKFMFRRMQRPVRDHDEIITAFRDGIVTLRKNRRTLGFTNSLKEIGYQGLRKGDLVIHAMDGHAGAIGVSDSDGKSSPVYSVCLPIAQENVYYYAYLLRYMALSGFIESLARGIRERSTEFRFNEFKGLDLLNPTVSEQTQIVNFLDRKTGQIDELIRIKERQVELLHEQRTALINQVVTKGLNPNVEMKPSGVEWIGEIPAHWTIRKNRHIFDEKNDRSVAGNEELLTVSHITGVSPRTEKSVNMFLAETLEGYKHCSVGNLVINTMWAWMGALGISEFDGIVSPAYNVYQLKNGEYLPKYYDYLYRTPNHVSEIIRWSKGIWHSRLRLYPDAFFSMSTLAPPFREQVQIVDFLNHKNQQIDALISTEQRKIELLKEYRQSLISEVVTGKIDVRNEV